MFETQVFIEGVGRVDFLLDGFLVVETTEPPFTQTARRFDVTIAAIMRLS